MTEILMMTLTAQLQKIAIQKRASHPSSIQETDLDFRKLVDNLEQAEVTMKLEETENLNLQYVNNIQTTTSQINNINDSDTDLSEKTTEIPNINEKNPKLKGKPSFKKWCQRSQIYNLQHFPLYLDCQSNHYEVYLLGKTTFKPIPYSSWIKNNTNKNFIKKESPTDKIILSVPPNNDSKYTINHVFTVHDPLDKKNLYRK